MELFDRIQNIRNLNKEEEIIKCIHRTIYELKGLNTWRMCHIYSACLLDKLTEAHISARIINTTWFGSAYEHEFVIVPDNYPRYYIIDLTFSQFQISDSHFTPFFTRGFMSMDEQEFEQYMDLFCIVPTSRLSELYYRR